MRVLNGTTLLSKQSPNNKPKTRSMRSCWGLYREKCQLLLDDVYVARPYIEIDNRIIELEKELEE